MPDRNESEARLAAIVASSDDAIISRDLTGTILSWNAAAERMFGYTAEEAIGGSIMLIVPDDRRAEEDSVMKQVTAGGAFDHVPAVRRHKDGRPVDVSLTGWAIRADTGEIIGVST